MARLPRIVVPGLPHHVTQRGNRRQAIFHQDEDYRLYLDLLAERCRHNGVQTWAYCLMPNHVHLIMTPSSAEGLARAVGEAHRRYTAYINARERVTGHLFQARFNSVAMDEEHLQAAVRYVAMNPVDAGLSQSPEQWRWSSTRAHLEGQDDALVVVRPVLDRIPNFADFVRADTDPAVMTRLMSGQTIGRPLVPDAQLAMLEREMGRRLRPLPRGPRRAGSEADG